MIESVSKAFWPVCERSYKIGGVIEMFRCDFVSIVIFSKNSVASRLSQENGDDSVGNQ